MPRWKPRDPITGQTPEDNGPVDVAGRSGKGKAQKALTVRLTEARLKNALLKNKKDTLVVKRLEGEVVDVEAMVRAVLANVHVVKTRLLTLPSKWALELASMDQPAEIEWHLRNDMIDVLKAMVAEELAKVANAA